MIPKAEEFYDKKDINGLPMSFNEKMIEFAKMHVEAALKAASEKAKIKYEYSGNTGSEYCDEYVDYNSITEAYPESNIK